MQIRNRIWNMKISAPIYRLIHEYFICWNNYSYLWELQPSWHRNVINTPVRTPVWTLACTSARRPNPAPTSFRTPVRTIFVNALRGPRIDKETEIERENKDQYISWRSCSCASLQTIVYLHVSLWSTPVAYTTNSISFDEVAAVFWHYWY